MSRAMWPNTDKRRLLMKSTTGGKLVREKGSSHQKLSASKQLGMVVNVSGRNAA